MPSIGESDVSRISLDIPVSTLPGIGEKRASALALLGIYTIRDMLFHLPREYRDRSTIQSISSAQVGMTITVNAEIISARSVRLRGKTTMAVLTIRDKTGTINASFFGRGFLTYTTLKKGTRCYFTGKVTEYKGLNLKNPEYEIVPNDEENATLHTGRIVPIYSLTEGITQRQLRQWVYNALTETARSINETLPPSLLRKHDLPPITEAIHSVHFPENMESAQNSRKRFAYEELLAMQLGILMNRRTVIDSTPGIAHTTHGTLLKRLKTTLPFKLTTGQEQSVNDILTDMAAPRPMFRLLQGDVGCGKTLVALHAVAVAADTGTQTAFMAPTEILAEQHFATLHQLLQPLGMSVVLLTGSTPNRKEIRKQIASGIHQVIVGTHALYQEQTIFHRLGLVIIDEQHRFGVGQRDLLAKKGMAPDILHTTATPIPRTLAITVYGGMDISVITDMPPGRLPVKTALMPENKKEELYQYIRDQAHNGYQSYIVCPLVEESERFSELTPLIDHYIALSEGPFSGLRCALLHGRLDPREKENIMARFKNREIDVLFATTVIEVGVDSPTATTMVIEDAGRFGLTQLHQLRGRVGRGNVQSWCFLAGKPSTPEGRKRLDILRTCNNGFDIAEADLKLRGPGEYCGARQSGLPDFRIADLLLDARLLDSARRDATQILERDPALELPEHALLGNAARRFASMFV